MRNRIVAAILTFTLLFSLCPYVMAEENKTENEAVSSFLNSDNNGYSEYNEKNQSMQNAVSDIILDNLKWENKSTTFSFHSDNALYELCFSYRCLTTADAIVEVKIDGKTPFSEAQQLRLPAVFYDESDEIFTNKNGDEAAPEQILYKEFVKGYARDYVGQERKPYKFLLSSGNHNVTISVISGSIEFDKIAFVKPSETKAYADSDNIQKTDELIIIEGEKAKYKNKRSLIALSDSGAMVHPKSPTRQLLNYIGGSNWETPGDEIAWQVEISESGWYEIGFDYRQNQLLGGISYRTLEIDGSVPCAEAEEINFPYTSSWKNRILTANGEPCQFYFEKGTHELKMIVTPGPVADIYAEMKTVTTKMADLYVSITMIVGETVDANRSYELFNQIPGFNNRLEEIIKHIDSIISKLDQTGKNQTNSNVSTFRSAKRVLETMMNNPYSSHLYKSDFYDAYTDLSALMGTIADGPLDIDRIILSGYKTTKKADYVGFAEKTAFSLKRLLHTYTKDYNTAAEDEDNGTLELWINWGRDQAQALNSLIQRDFVTKTGIDVNVSIVNATIIQAILSGKGPDCLLQMQRTDPVNYAMRGALASLSEFGDLDDVLERFSPNAAVPYTYNNEVYALPDTQSFFMMFVRTDIFEKMGIAVPKTWDEFIDAGMQLQRSNLQISMSYTKISGGIANNGVGSTSLYPSLMIQNGLNLYSSDKLSCTLAETKQVKLFSNWTDWYTKYKFPVQTDFFNRFRIGSAPLGIVGYTMYAQLKDAAPEIEGRWIMTQIPGTVLEDGTVNNQVAGSGTACAITKMSKQPKKAWEFLKWWTSEETQLNFSERMESVLGTLGRVATSNIEALKKMHWDSETREELISVLKEKIVEIEEVPGGYYTARGIDQAFWATTEQDAVAADSLVKWSKIVNDEISRKTKQYSKQS